METSDVQSFEKLINYLWKLEVDVSVYFDGASNIVGKISHVGTDFFELEIRIPGGRRKAICPFWSVQYLSADYERDPNKVIQGNTKMTGDRIEPRTIFK